MQYSYVALNQENQKLTGVISAADEQSARTQLKNMGFQLISIVDISENPISANNLSLIQTYHFKGLNKQAKEVVGTIEAGNEKEAYQRLILEYHLNVLMIYNAKTEPQNQEIEGYKNLEKYQKELEEEFGINVKEFLDNVDLQDNNVQDQASPIIEEKEQLILNELNQDLQNNIEETNNCAIPKEQEKQDSSKGFLSSWLNIGSIFKFVKFNTVEREIKEIIHNEQQKTSHQDDVHKRVKSLFYEEAQAFTGWLLGFYILYFFVAAYSNLKFEQNDFIEKSLNTPFLYMFSIALFFVFSGLTLKNHYAKDKAKLSWLIGIVTVLVMLVYMINF